MQVNRKQHVLLSLLAAGAALVLGLLLARPAPLPDVSALECRFDSGRALQDTATLARQYPRRVTGEPGAARAASYLRDYFAGLGLRASFHDSTMWLAGRRVPVRNVVALDPGNRGEYVVLMAHYDSQYTSDEAAADNASGTAALMELARALSARQPDGLPVWKHRRSIVYVATDAEEWGMVGARNYIRAPGIPREQIAAAVSLDYINHGAPAGVQVSSGGQGPGFAPLWLRRLAEAAVRGAGARSVHGGPGWELIERAVRVSFQDHGPFNTLDVPALNLAVAAADTAAERLLYHTPDDRVEGIRPESLAMAGCTAERMARALDTAPLAREDHNYFLLSGSYLAHGTTLLLAVLLFVPLLYLAARAPAPSLETLKRLLPLAGGYAALVAAARMNLFPRYELYPATLKDPFLGRVPWVAVVAAAAGAVLVWLFLRLLAGRSRVNDPHASLKWLAGVVLVTIALNRYAAVFFLWVPAFFWPLAVTRRRAVNVLLLVLGAAPFLALIVSFAHLIYVGPYLPFYLLLQAAYGVWSPTAVLLFLCTGAVASQWVSAVGVAAGAGAEPSLGARGAPASAEASPPGA